jgi:hypothetical protein
VTACEVIHGEHVSVRDDLHFDRFRCSVDNAENPLSSFGGSTLPGGGLLHLSDCRLVQLSKERK